MESVGAIPEWWWECPYCGCEETSEMSNPSGIHKCGGCDEEYDVYQT